MRLAWSTRLNQRLNETLTPVIQPFVNPLNSVGQGIYGQEGLGMNPIKQVGDRKSTLLVMQFKLSATKEQPSKMLLNWERLQKKGKDDMIATGNNIQF